MPIVKRTTVVGTYVHPASGQDFEYDVECRIAVDQLGRESMHIKGLVARGNASTGFTVLGRVDPRQSFIGREAQVALDCVAVACERVARPPPASCDVQDAYVTV